MSSKFMIITALSFTAALVFGAGFKLGQSHEILRPYSQAKAERHEREGRPHADLQTKANRIAAIIVMPRSYLPLLEKFKHSKVARRVEILPAHIDQQDNRLIAISQQPVRLKPDQSEASVKNGNRQARPKHRQETLQITKIAQGAAILSVLKGAAKSKLRFAAHRSAQKAGL